MLLSLRIGFLPSPAASAALSIREEVLQAATTVVERDSFTAPAPVARPHVLSSVTGGASPSATASAETIRTMQRDKWRHILADSLSGNQALANAVMWLASAPVRLRVSGEKVFVGITVRTP